MTRWDCAVSGKATGRVFPRTDLLITVGAGSTGERSSFTTGSLLMADGGLSA
jgi:hypothetical protein